MLGAGLVHHRIVGGIAAIFTEFISADFVKKVGFGE